MEKPPIGPDEVLVRVGANTVCGTDVRILRGEKTRGIGRDVVFVVGAAGEALAQARPTGGVPPRPERAER